MTSLCVEKVKKERKTRRGNKLDPICNINISYEIIVFRQEWEKIGRLHFLEIEREVGLWISNGV